MPVPPHQLTVTDLAASMSEELEDHLRGVYGDDTATVESLLLRPTPEWPTSGTNSDLATFATNRRMYLAFLGSIAKGIRVTTAAKALRVTQNKVEIWLKKGAADVREERESVYAWFYLDCFQARGMSECEAEFRAFQSDPVGFLKRIGVGGQFNEIEPPGVERVFRQQEGQTDLEEADNSIGSSDVLAAIKSLVPKGALDMENWAEEAGKQIPNTDDRNTPES